MDCDRCMELISARLDGPLSPEEEAARRAHLAHCPACRAVEGQLAALHKGLSALEDLPAPEGFAQSVLERIQAEAQPSPCLPRRLREKKWTRSLAGLAACALLCVGLYHTDFLADQENSVPAPSAALSSVDPEVSSSTSVFPDCALSSAPEEPRSRSSKQIPAAADGLDTDAQESLQEQLDTAPAPEAYSYTAELKPSLTLSRLPEGWEEILSLEDALPIGPEETPRYSATSEQVSALLTLSQNQDIAASLSAPLCADLLWTVILAPED